MSAQGAGKHNIVIIGGGPVGATLALSLAKKGVKSTILEARAKGAAYPDGRALALSFGTKMILEGLGVWRVLVDKVTVIETIHISQKGSFGRSLLKAQEHQLPALGYVVSYGTLSAALDNVLALYPNLVHVEHEAIASEINPCSTYAKISYQDRTGAHAMSCALAVLADGGRSLGDIEGFHREVKEYGQDALVTKISAELAHQNIAYERFTATGPMALLPNGARDFSLVWTGEQSSINQLMNLDDSTFLAQLHEAFGDRVGRFLNVQKRLSFSLRLATLKPSASNHVVVIGNAAQTMHPVAGQGFNVGLRDAEALTSVIAQTLELKPELLGGEAMLNIYLDARKNDTKRGLMFTDFLVNLFSNDLIGVSASRAAALSLLDVIKPAKNYLVNKMSFGK